MAINQGGNSSNNRYSALISNTFLFALSTFVPKVLSFLLYPIITGEMDPAISGVAENIINFCNLILPIMYLCVNEAIVRFGLDRKTSQSDVYTTGVLTVLGGFVIVLLTSPIINRVSMFQGYHHLIYFFVLASALRTVTTHFVRSQGHVRLFALDGIVTSVLTLVSTVVFLVVFDGGITGYLLATIVPDIISALGLTLIAKTYTFFSIPDLDWKVSKSMLRYSIPLVPAAVSWWITNGSALFFITAFISESASGIYSWSNRIPQLLMMVSQVFIQAWQLSAFSETDHKEAESFFSIVFRSYYALVFLAASGIVLLVRPLTSMLLADKYYQAWTFSAPLVISVVFSCFVTFLGTVYNYVKKNRMVTITTLLAAVISLGLNTMLIPKIGAFGATIATFSSYFIVFLVRLYDSKKYIKLDYQPAKFFTSTALLLVQIFVSLSQPKHGFVIQVGMVLLMALINISQIIYIVQEGWKMLKSLKKA